MNNVSHGNFGIDISKDELELAMHGQRRTRRFANDQQGIAALIETLGQTPQLIVLEATGGYERPLQAALHAQDLPVATMNPLRVRDYAKGLGVLAKNDHLDALVIARFGHDVKPMCDEKPDEKRQKRADLVARRRQLVKLRVAESNRLKQTVDAEALQSIRDVIKVLDQQIDGLKCRLDQVIKEDPQAERQQQILLSVKGVGEITAHTLINELPELGRCSRARIAALVGLAPFDRDSGKMKGIRTIRGGRASVRAVLYMATLSARRSNPVIRSHYEHLRARGKKFKVAMVACMRKMLIHLNNLVSERQKSTATP